MQENNKADLIKAVSDYKKSGSEANFSRLYELSHRDLLNYIFSMIHSKEVAEDLLQETYIRIMESISTLKSPEMFPAWSMKIAQSTVMSYFNNKGEQFIEQSTMNDIPHDKAVLPEDSAEYEALSRNIAKTLEEIPSAQRQVFTCRFLEEMSISETAKVLDMSEEEVKVNANRAKEAICKAMVKFIKRWEQSLPEH